MKRFLLLFLSTGISYGLIMSLVQDAGFDLGNFLFNAVSFGLLMAVFTLGWEKSRMRRKGIKPAANESGNLLGVTQRKTIPLRLAPHQLLPALQNDARTAKLKPLQQDDAVVMSSGTSWVSWGEDISVVLLEVLPGAYEYRITSKAKLSTTLIDYGKNLENVQLIAQVLQDAEAAVADALPLRNLEKDLDAPLDREGDLYL